MQTFYNLFLFIVYACPITSPMRAAGPTTRPAHSALELREGFLDADIPRFGFFAGGHPTDPLIARQRRDVVPD